MNVDKERSLSETAIRVLSPFVITRELFIKLSDVKHRSFLKRNLSCRKKSELTTPEQSSWPSVSFSIDFNPTIGPIIATLCTVTKINTKDNNNNNNNNTTIPIPNSTNLPTTSAPPPPPPTTTTTTIYTPIAACSCIMPPSSSLTHHNTTTTKVYTTFAFPLPTHAAYSDDIAMVFIQEDEKIGGKVPLAQFSGGHRMGLLSSPSGGGGGGDGGGGGSGGGGETGEAAAASGGKGGGKREVSPFISRAQVLTSVEDYAIDLTGDEPVEICTSTKVKVPCKPVKCSAEVFQYYKAPNGGGSNSRNNNLSSSINGVEGLVAFGLLQSNTAIHAAIVPLNKLESRRPLRGDSSMETVVLKIRNNNNNNNSSKVGNGRRGASVPTSFSQGAFTLSFVDDDPQQQQQSAEQYSASSKNNINLISYKIALDPPTNSKHREKHATTRPISIKIEPGTEAEGKAEGAAGPSTAGPSFLHHEHQQHEEDQKARERDGTSPPPPPSTTAAATTTTSTEPPPPKYQFHYCEYGGKFRVVDWKPEWTCPYDCCAMQCRDFTSLQHHLLAMHPYQEYWFDYYDAGYHQRQRQRQAQAIRGPPGSQQKQQSQQQELQPQGDNQKQKQQQDKGHARIYSRCRSSWFKKDGGDFYPLSIPANDDGDGTVLGPLLSRTEREMPFIYHCPKSQRKLRFKRNAKYPVDTWERRLESLAEKQRQREEEEEAEAEEEVEVGVGEGGGGRRLKSKSKNDISNGNENGGQGAVVGASSGKNNNNNNREDSKKRKLQQLAATTTTNKNNNKQKQPPSKKSRGVGPHSRPSGRRGIALLNRDGRPKFYHSQTCVMMMADEILNSREDSDQEEDVEEWKRDCIERLREVVGLCPEERKFMYEWNMFVRERTVHADADMTETCVAFAQMYKRQLAVVGNGGNGGNGSSVRSGNDAFRRCFIGHLLNLWSFRLISYEHMNKILKVASGGEDGGKS